MKFTVTIQQKLEVSARDKYEAKRVAEDRENAPFRDVSGVSSLRTLPGTVRVMKIEQVES